MCGTLNNAAFSTPCMRLFAANRPNSATPQTVGLVVEAKPASHNAVLTSVFIWIWGLFCLCMKYHTRY